MLLSLVADFFIVNTSTLDQIPQKPKLLSNLMFIVSKLEKKDETKKQNVRH